MWLVATVLHRPAENLEKLPCCSQRNLEAQEPDNYRQCLYWFARPKNFPLQVDVWKKSCETVILIIGSQSEGGSFTSVRRRRSLWAISVSKEMHVLFSSLAPYTKVRDKFNIGWKQPKKWILCTFPKGEPSTSHHFSWKNALGNKESVECRGGGQGSAHMAGGSRWGPLRPATVAIAARPLPSNEIQPQNLKPQSSRNAHSLARDPCSHEGQVSDFQGPWRPLQSWRGA